MSENNSFEASSSDGFSNGKEEELLDFRFQRDVQDMKPFALSLPSVHERQRMGLWIEKLCSSNAFASVILRKNRNLYAQILLQMLRCGKLDEPFTKAPPHGQLKIIPAYMSVHWDQRSVGSAGKATLFGTSGAHESTSAGFHHSLDARQSKGLNDVSSVEISTDLKNVTAADYRLFAMQRHHDAAVQDILEQKNNEMEEQRNLFNDRLADAMEMIANLKRQLHSVSRESHETRQRHKEQVDSMANELKRTGLAEQQFLQLKMQEMSIDQEKAITKLQDAHVDEMQAIVDKARLDMSEVRRGHVKQVEELESHIRELNSSGAAMASELQLATAKLDALAVDKVRLAEELESSARATSAANNAMISLETDLTRVSEQHHLALANIREGYDRTRKETESNLTAQINTLTEACAQYKQDLQRGQQRLIEADADAEKRIERHIAENLEQLQRKVDTNSIKRKLDDNEMAARLDEANTQKAIEVTELQLQLKASEDQIISLQEQKAAIKRQAENSISAFKRQMTQNSGELFLSLKMEMERVEMELSQAKESIITQDKDHDRQRTTEAELHAKEIASLQLKHDAQLDSLKRACDVDTEEASSRHLQEMNEMRRCHTGEIEAARHDAAEQRDHLTQSIREMEAEIIQLRKEVLEANGIRKQQITELAAQRDEERVIATRRRAELESALTARHKDELTSLKREHRRAVTRTIAEAEAQLQTVKAERSAKAVKEHKIICLLRDQIKCQKEALSSIRNEHGAVLASAERTSRNALIQLQQSSAKIIKGLQAHISDQRREGDRLKDANRNTQLEMQQKIALLKLDYESKMEGCLPLAIRTELEDTIVAMRQQIDVIGSRANILQEQLNRLQPPS